MTIKTLAEVEKEHILAVYEQLGQDKVRVARALGVCLKTLYNKLHSYGVIGPNYHRPSTLFVEVKLPDCCSEPDQQDAA